MKPLAVLTILFFVPNTSPAEELCAQWERKIEPDMQIQESDFTLERFDRALETLLKVGHEARHSETWLIEGNSLQFVHGWLLKKAALEAAEDFEKEEAVRVFCEFLVNEAFYYD